MSNFEVLGEIVSRCFGDNREGIFQNIWIQRKSDQIRDTVERSTFGLMMLEYIEDLNNRIGKGLPRTIDVTATDLQTAFLCSKRYKQETLKKTWLYEVSTFGTELSKMIISLDAVGIKITRLDKKRNNQRIIHIDFTEWSKENI